MRSRFTCLGETPVYCGIEDPKETCEGCIQKIPFTTVSKFIDSTQPDDQKFTGSLIEVARTVKEKFNLTDEQLWVTFSEWFSTE